MTASRLPAEVRAWRKCRASGVPHVPGGSTRSCLALAWRGVPAPGSGAFPAQRHDVLAASPWGERRFKPDATGDLPRLDMLDASRPRRHGADLRRPGARHRAGMCSRPIGEAARNEQMDEIVWYLPHQDDAACEPDGALHARHPPDGGANVPQVCKSGNSTPRKPPSFRPTSLNVVPAHLTPATNHHETYGRPAPTANVPSGPRTQRAAARPTRPVQPAAVAADPEPTASG
jgi:hypothetical protein